MIQFTLKMSLTNEFDTNACSTLLYDSESFQISVIGLTMTFW